MILQADARHIPLADKSVHCCVTSPPYWGLRDYGLGDRGIGLETTPEAFVCSLVQVFREVRRVLRDDGTLWLVLGDSYNGGNKGNSGNIRPGDKQGTNVGSWSTRRRDSGTLSPTRSGGAADLKVKDLCGIPWRAAFALQADGWYLRSDIIWSKPNPMPESVTDRPTKAHEYVFLLSKSERYFWDQEAVREKGIYPAGVEATGSLARFGRDEKLISGNAHRGNTIPITTGTRNIRTVWEIATQPYSGSHFATFPEELVRRCIAAGCPEAGIVVDPFGGSGTVGKVAKRMLRRYVCADLNLQYLQLMRERIPPLALVGCP